MVVLKPRCLIDLKCIEAHLHLNKKIMKAFRCRNFVVEIQRDKNNCMEISGKTSYGLSG